MASHQSETTRANLAFFLLGIFVTLSVIGVFSIGSMVFFRWQRGSTPLVTGEENLGQLIQTDVNLFWTLAPNIKNKQVTETLANDQHSPSTYTYSTNELGFRSPPLYAVGSRFRILAIGDSTTFGQHVADHETWPAQLQQILDPKAEVIEVINAGVIGASSFQGLSFLNTRGLALKPNVIVATFGYNDWAEAELSDRHRATILQRRGTLQMVMQTLLGGNIPKTNNIEWRKRATPGEYLDHMIEIANLCRANDIPVILIMWPCLYNQKETGDYLPPYKSLIMEASVRSYAHSIDLTPFFENAPEPIFLDRVHATPAGYRIVAETLAAYLKESQWLPIQQL